MVLNLTDEEFFRMKSVALDEDRSEALKLIKEFIKRIEQQKNGGMKSHLEK